MSSRVFVKLLINCHHKHIYIFLSALCLDLLPHILEGRMPVSRSDRYVWGKLSSRRKGPVYREVGLPDFYSRSGKRGSVGRVFLGRLGLWGADYWSSSGHDEPGRRSVSVEEGHPRLG